MLPSFLSSDLFPGAIITCQFYVQTNESSREFPRSVGCNRRSGSCCFPAVIVSRGEYDCNAPEAMMSNPSVMAKHMISVDHFVEHVTFEPCLLNEIHINLL